MYQLSLDARVRIAAALVDGMSIRAVERLTGHHRDTVMRFGIEAGERNNYSILQIGALSAYVTIT